MPKRIWAGRLLAVLATAVLFEKAPALAQDSEAAGVAADVTGEVEVEVVDYEHGGKSETIYSLKDRNTKKRYRLRAPPGGEKKLRPGTEVRIKGRRRNDEITFALGGVSTESTGSIQPMAAGVPLAGTRKALAVLVDFADSSVACTESTVRTTLYSAAGTRSLNGYYDDASSKSLAVTGDSIRVKIANKVAATSCGYYVWADNADVQAAKLRDLGAYNHIIYVLPDNAPCTWLGMAQINNKRSWVKKCTSPLTFVHEFGHNLGMHHASTFDGSEYGDVSDPMGNAWRGLNVPHSIQLGWTPPNKVASLGPSGRYYLSPLHGDPLTSPYPHVLKIPKENTGESYYLSFRKAEGLFDATISTTYAGKLSVHRADDPTVKTYSHGGFGVGSTFSDSANGISVKPVSATADSLTLDVTVPECVPTQPTVTVSPTKKTGAAGAALDYTVSVKSNDKWNCPPGSFKLTSTRPSGFFASYSASALTIAPGATALATARITSSAGYAVKDYTWWMNATHQSNTTLKGSASAVYGITSTAPSAPSSLKATVSGTTVTLTWTASRSSVPLKRYTIYRNGTYIGQAIGTLTYKNTLVPKGTHRYSAKAQDTNLAFSSASNSVYVTIP